MTTTMKVLEIVALQEDLEEEIVDRVGMERSVEVER